MITRNDLKQFTRKELEDIILSRAGISIFASSIEMLIRNKSDDKHLAYETKIETLQRRKEEWIADLKKKYGVEEDKQLFSKMSFEEKIKYLKMVEEINDTFDEDSKLYDKEYKEWEKRHKK